MRGPVMSPTPRKPWITPSNLLQLDLLIADTEARIDRLARSHDRASARLESLREIRETMVPG